TILPKPTPAHHANYNPARNHSAPSSFNLPSKSSLRKATIISLDDTLCDYLDDVSETSFTAMHDGAIRRIISVQKWI
ncbi:MAG: hypothetical protein ACSLEL_02840, partial [Candidatus Malihini olakiniferum]